MPAEAPMTDAGALDGDAEIDEPTVDLRGM